MPRPARRCGLDLRGRAYSGHLTGRAHQLSDQFTKVLLRLPYAETNVIPRRPEIGAMLLDVCDAFLGQLGSLAAGDLFDDDESFVLELGQRGIDGTRTRLPDAAAALDDLLNQFVAVHRLFRS